MLLVLTLGTFAFSEIMYDWPGADTNHEWVELVNCLSAAVEITDNSRFFDGSNHLIAGPVQGARLIPASGVFVLAADAKTATSTFFIDYPNFSGTVFDTATKPLANTSATLELRGEAGTILASVTYQSAWGGQASGKSIEKENPCDGNPNAGWRESSAVGGTPGSAALVLAAAPAASPSPTPSPVSSPTPSPTAQPASAPASGSSSYSSPSPSPALVPTTASSPTPKPATPTSVPAPSPLTETKDESEKEPALQALARPSAPLLNEISPSPVGPDTANEYVELFNASATTFDLSGWFLDDGEGGSAPYQFPANTIIQPQTFLVFAGGQTKLALNNSGDSVRLLDEAKAQKEAVAYGKAEEGFAWAKDDGGAWRWTKLPTPGGRNAFVAVESKNNLKTQSSIAERSEPKASPGAVAEASPTPFALDLTQLPPEEPLTARIANSDTRSFVLAGSLAVALALLLVFARRFF